MPSLLDMLGRQLGGDTVRQLSRQLGTDEGATENAISAALPLLLGALARNSANPAGAEALSSALARDHDGSLLDHLSDFLGSGNTRPGDGILNHVFGGRRDTIAAGVGRASGLDPGAAGNLLSMLAPLVLVALGRAQRQQGLDAGGLSSVLGDAQSQLQTAAPGLEGLARLLDTNNDGQIMDDVVRIGGGLLGRFFRGR